MVSSGKAHGHKEAIISPAWECEKTFHGRCCPTNTKQEQWRIRDKMPNIYRVSA